MYYFVRPLDVGCEPMHPVEERNYTCFYIYKQYTTFWVIKEWNHNYSF